MNDASTQPRSREAPARPEPALEERDRAVFVLRYDDEIAYLVNEGVLRPGTQPSGLKDK